MASSKKTINLSALSADQLQTIMVKLLQQQSNKVGIGEKVEIDEQIVPVQPSIHPQSTQEAVAETSKSASSNNDNKNKETKTKNGAEDGKATELDIHCEEILINEIRNYGCIWNTSQRAYRETTKAKEAWKLIATKLGKEGIYAFSYVQFHHNSIIIFLLKFSKF